jgi:leucyl-tRNA synthetase
MDKEKYSPTTIELKWAKAWQEQGLYKALDYSDKPKSYILIEFPYPSGERLHVGHARSYSCLDAVARMRRMKGMNVLFPIGWDAFGLPAENYAIKNGVHPAVTTAKNIANSKKQAISWGLSFDWDREVNTTDPNYYKWTQWIFVQLFKKGLAYKQEIAVNWCPSCKTNLANEEVVDGKCERCGTETERRLQSQWLLKITEYADRLLDDLKTVNFREDIAAQQVNWIGRKGGAKVKFKLEEQYLEAFTTRIDTLFGVTFVVVAPEVMSGLMSLVPESHKANVLKYMSTALNKSERERKQKSEKTGTDTGLKVLNPANGEYVPLWVADYVMMDVGTGVVMGVPGHDMRDLAFATENSLPVRKVIQAPENVDDSDVWEGEGRLCDSGEFDGVESLVAREKMVEKGLGVKINNYHLRDWVFSRQHYWGEPIPMIRCEKDGWIPVPDEDLPVRLPDVEKYQPTGTGESPLAHIDSFVNITCPKCGGPARRETDTMPNWAGSSWYFLRYIDAHNDKEIADKKKLEYWMPVDWYNGGMEHTTLHLLYSRFWHKVLYDLGVVNTTEPYAKRSSHGVVLGPDGRKMSKSKGNVINPDEIVAKYGADTLRMYEMFIGPFEQMVAWSDESLEGVFRFLKRVWVLVNEMQISNNKSQINSEETRRKLAILIKKVEEDLEAAKFNTVVAAMMEFVNWWTVNPKLVSRDDVMTFLKLLAPMAPFISEELFQRLSDKSAKSASIHVQPWPLYQAEHLAGGSVTVMVQVDGKIRGKLEFEADKASIQSTVEAEALNLPNVQKYLIGKQKIVFVPKRLVNFINL